MLKVKIKKTHSEFKMPVMGSEDAACYDVSIADIKFDSEGVVMINLGFQTEIPKGWKGVIVPRSNISKFGYVMPNSPGQVDSDYRGDWMIKFQRIEFNGDRFKGFPYSVGERCAQIYFERVNEVELVEVKKLTDTIRGSGGFGSTGK